MVATIGRFVGVYNVQEAREQFWITMAVLALCGVLFVFRADGDRIATPILTLVVGYWFGARRTAEKREREDHGTRSNR